jgi:glycosyltransferase involved in cell wall biosynthesis
MRDQLTELNPDINPAWFPLVTLGADPISFELERRAGTVVTVGKAEPRKGIRILLQALKELELSAYLAVTSPLHTQPELERIQDYADAGGHYLLNFHSVHEEILALLSSCHVAVFPACAEGWGLAVTEALAQGCVVVASDIILVPTQMIPMTPHQRWYPSVLYPGVQWLEVTPDDLKTAITEALTRPFPREWKPGEFPLTWKRAAERLSNAIEDRPVLNKQRRAVFGKPE